ncbi:MAG: metal ABC transporter ATP-binding protein, partial [Fervidicoccaceae archaeon]
IIENMTFGYRGTGIIQIIGPNGAGKSTLLRGILGLVKPKKGKVEINGIDITGKSVLASKYISFVPQLTISEKNIVFPISARELLSFELKASGQKFDKKTEEEVIRMSAEIVGLSERELDKDIRSFSGGQKQKVFIARAILHDRPILILDEPLSSIDPSTREELAKKIIDFSNKKLILITSHDPAVFMEKTSRLLILNRKTYFFGEPSEVMREEVLEKVYGKMLTKLGTHVHIFDDSCAHIQQK